MGHTGFFLRGEVDGWVRFTAWASLAANMLLILTGGLVRLTGSGLGCPTWPRCTDESWTNTSEMGIHGFIEFGNRTLTGVLMIVAVLAFLAVVRMARRHASLFVLTLLLADSVLDPPETAEVLVAWAVGLAVGLMVRPRPGWGARSVSAVEQERVAAPGRPSGATGGADEHR